MADPVLVYDWQTGGGTGWGTYGAALARYAPRFGVRLLSLHVPKDGLAVETVTADRIPKGAITLTGMGIDGGTIRDGYPIPAVRPARQVGVIFSENAEFSTEGVRRLRQYDMIVAGSTWNAQTVLGSASGIGVNTVFQGIDPSVFSLQDDGARNTPHGVGPYIFSGGKLELRKGQDRVMAAFRRLLVMHPDAVLVTAWHNAWPATMRSLPQGHIVETIPTASSGEGLSAWLSDYGIPRANHWDIGPCDAIRMAAAMRSCDAAIFPNRCEGGTNLVAMEALACGVPCVLTPDTGHADLMQFSGAIASESDPDALAVALAIAVRRSHAPCTPPMWTWEHQIRTLVETVRG